MTSTNFYRITTIISIVIILFLVNCQRERDVIKVPVRIEVPIPAIKGKTDTIYKPVPYRIEVPTPVNDSLLIQYTATKDSLERLRMFVWAITVREYQTEFEDENIKIDTYSRVRGELLAQSNDYFIKPRTITVDTTLEVSVPRFNALYLYGGAKYSLIDKSAGFEAKLVLINKKNNLLSVGLDTQGFFSAGLGFKLN
jgi:hypothetical protein